MRPIDADAMIADLLTVDPRYETMIQWCCRVVDAQPTIEERKTGRWINNDKINLPQCSECKMWIDVMQQSGKMNFCPNCGCKMEVEHG